MEQGILNKDRIKLLCVPDYLFFRTHPHKLYREYKGIPRYSIITRKITDEAYFNNDDLNKNDRCSIDTLYIVDGATALNNTPVFFPITRKLDISVIGTNLNFFELPKLRYLTLSDQFFEKFTPITINSKNITYDKLKSENKRESKSIDLLPSFELKTKKGMIVSDNTIAIGSVRYLNDFFPNSFDALRINLGDFVEYNQNFQKAKKPDFPSKSQYISLVISEIGNLINLFSISIVFISLYKIAKFLNFALDKKNSLKNQIGEILEGWNFSEYEILLNMKRRLWEKANKDYSQELIDRHGYIIMFNKP